MLKGAVFAVGDMKSVQNALKVQFTHSNIPLATSMGAYAEDDKHNFLCKSTNLYECARPLSCILAHFRDSLEKISHKCGRHPSAIWLC